MDVVLATCLNIPEPDADEAVLLSALSAAGLRACTLAWDDPAADFGAARLCVLRSTWNYHHDRPRFLSWAERTAAVTRLRNPLPVVRANTHKGYLRSLADRGVPVTPTAWVARGDERARLADVLAQQGWRTAVVKPAVSAGSFATLRVGDGGADLATGQAHLERITRERDAMVQCYLPSVEDYGERALVWIDGALTHAVRKSPRFAADAESVSDAVPIAPEERALAECLAADFPPEVLYARIDVARDATGRVVVMELELTEPSLFLRQSTAALERFAAALVRSARA
jgi:hypothetical protein